MRFLNTKRFSTHIHYLSYIEISKDKDDERRAILKSKLKNYNKLEFNLNPLNDREFMESVSMDPDNKHNLIDINLLYAIYKSACDVLITEDKKILKQSEKLGIKSKVLNIADFIKRCSDIEKILPTTTPSIKLVYTNELDFEDKIFESIELEYDNFASWKNKLKHEKRPSYVLYNKDNTIGALMILKEESEAINSDPPFPIKRRLKICTLKVSEKGYNIGEQFIRIAVRYCIANDINEIYLTTHTKVQEELVSLIKKYGFIETGQIGYKKDIGPEHLYLKNTMPPKDCILDPISVADIYYPSFKDGPEINKFIIPIKNDFHDKLFSEGGSTRQPKIYEYLGKTIAENNAINKVYISHSKITKIEIGDILLFYKSHIGRELTNIGVVRSVEKCNDFIELISKTRNQTVYNYTELEELIEEKEVLLIFFSFCQSFLKKIKYRELMSMGILNGPPQSIQNIAHEKYIKLKEKGGIDERYTCN